MLKNSFVLFCGLCLALEEVGLWMFRSCLSVFFGPLRGPPGILTGSTVFDTRYRACVPDRGVGEKVSAMTDSRKLGFLVWGFLLGKLKKLMVRISNRVRSSEAVLE